MLTYADVQVIGVELDEHNIRRAQANAIAFNKTSVS
jgi:tRNA/tmRNA/rRNA uracil-C5-methylase (TrmA/RlmC/RlmD family)